MNSPQIIQVLNLFYFAFRQLKNITADFQQIADDEEVYCNHVQKGIQQHLHLALKKKKNDSTWGLCKVSGSILQRSDSHFCSQFMGHFQNCNQNVLTFQICSMMTDDEMKQATFDGVLAANENGVKGCCESICICARCGHFACGRYNMAHAIVRFFQFNNRSNSFYLICYYLLECSNTTLI